MPAEATPFQGPLRLVREAREHLCLAEGTGARVLVQLFAAVPDAARAARIVLVDPVAGAAEALRRLEPAGLHLAEGPADALRRLDRWLEAARMGARFYAAGGADLLGRASKLAAGHAMAPDAVQAALHGPAGRRVRCVHCRREMPDVVGEAVRCTGCGIELRVRDLYSARHGAFMGLCAEPGRSTVPEGRAL